MFYVAENVMAGAGWLSLISWLLVRAGADYVGHSVVGDVEEGNYTYYTLRQPGHLKLNLISDLGDADLYVSGAETERPTFYFDEHELSSATCGLDTVYITPSLTRNCSRLAPHSNVSFLMNIETVALEQGFRPIHIGVYGHPNYQTSKFKLEVLIEETKNERDYFNENDVYSDTEQEDDYGAKSDDEDEAIWKQGHSSTLKMIFSIIGSIIEILLEVLI